MKTFIYFAIISILIFNVNSSECLARKSLLSKTFDNCQKCNYKKGCTKCEDNYYINNGRCKKCPNHCTSCLGTDICTKCEHFFIKFRESPTDILCILKDDRMNIDKCSMYIQDKDNDEFKCVDCEKGYKLNFQTQECESSPTRTDDIDDIL